jgi:hypothetical protein
MKLGEQIATLYFYPTKDPKKRLFALWYFAIFILLLQLFGHTIIGFEQSDAQTLIALGTAIAAQFGLEWVDAKCNKRPPRFMGSWKNFANMFPPAIIVGCAIGMLIYAGDRITPFIFAPLMAISSKVLFRAPVHNTTQHVFNPSNLGLVVTYLWFADTVHPVPPYQFTADISGIWDWVVPGVFLVTGMWLHKHSTGRLPLIFAWIVGFVAQGELRGWLFGLGPVTPLVSMTGAGFILFTLYMIPDPATTPVQPRRQIAFGLACAATYAILQTANVISGLFFCLAIVAAARGIYLWAVYFDAKAEAASRAKMPATAPGNGIPATAAAGATALVEGERRTA